MGIAQSVRAPDCGSGGRGFDSPYSPHNSTKYRGVAKSVRHGTLTPACVGSSPAAPAIFFCGPLAQLVEHLTFNQGVDGSSPSWLTIHARMVELADTLDLGSSALRCGGSTPPSRTTVIMGSGHLLGTFFDFAHRGRTFYCHLALKGTSPFCRFLPSIAAATKAKEIHFRKEICLKETNTFLGVINWSVL